MAAGASSKDRHRARSMADDRHGHRIVAVVMVLQLIACQVVVDALLDRIFLEAAFEGIRFADRYRPETRTLTELFHQPSDLDIYAYRGDDEPSVRVRVDRWIVELIAELVESRKASPIRAFVREAILEHVDRITLGNRPAGT